MPSLTFTSDGRALGGLLTGRVLIGRGLSHGVAFNDRSVSRLHAWIDPIDDGKLSWVITDAGSRTGTFVNKQKVERHTLKDGDKIQVGNAGLTFCDHNALAPGMGDIELSFPLDEIKTAGILFDCACGAPLWVGNELAGKRGLCRHCRQPVTVPELPKKITPTLAPTPAPNDAAPVTPTETAAQKRHGKCAVCHSDISQDEQAITCPDCAMTFHNDCWQENLGCSTYGCPQVNALAPKAMVDHSPGNEPSPGDHAPAEPTLDSQTPWDVILIAASVVGSLIGALAFGSLAAVVAVMSLIALIRGKQRRPILLIVAIAVSLIGIAAGLVASDFWYLHSRHLPAMLRIQGSP